MKKEVILGYAIDMTRQVSKPKKQVADIQLNRRDLVVGANGSLMDKDSFIEWESDKRNTSYE